MTPWIMHPSRRTSPSAQLLCFPHAGAGASVFNSWAGLLPESVEVGVLLAPGREERISEPPVTEWSVLLESIMRSLRREPTLPTVLFGHSFGARVAYEIAKRIAAELGHRPAGLIVSACPAPDFVPPGKPTREKSDAEFIKTLERTGGMPKVILDEPEFMEMLLPGLRADFTLYEEYRPAPDERAPCDVIGLAAKSDREVAASELANWGNFTGGRFRCETVEGDHFYYLTEEGRKAAAGHVLAALGSYLK